MMFKASCLALLGAAFANAENVLSLEEVESPVAFLQDEPIQLAIQHELEIGKFPP